MKTIALVITVFALAACESGVNTAQGDSTPIAADSAKAPAAASIPDVPGGPVDTTLVREVDVDGDGIRDSVILRVTAPKFSAPFQRELRIVSAGGRTLLQRTESDEDIDSDFADSSFTDPCIGYERCKREWYFDQYLESIVVLPAPVSGVVYERASGMSIWDFATPHLMEKCGATKAAAEAAVDSAVVRMKADRVAAVFDYIVPVHGGTPHIWFAEFGCFAPVYRE